MLADRAQLLDLERRHVFDELGPSVHVVEDGEHQLLAHSLEAVVLSEHFAAEAVPGAGMTESWVVVSKVVAQVQHVVHNMAPRRRVQQRTCLVCLLMCLLVYSHQHSRHKAFQDAEAHWQLHGGVEYLPGAQSQSFLNVVVVVEGAVTNVAWSEHVLHTVFVQAVIHEVEPLPDVVARASWRQAERASRARQARAQKVLHNVCHSNSVMTRRHACLFACLFACLLVCLLVCLLAATFTSQNRTRTRLDTYKQCWGAGVLGCWGAGMRELLLCCEEHQHRVTCNFYNAPAANAPAANAPAANAPAAADAPAADAPADADAPD